MDNVELLLKEILLEIRDLKLEVKELKLKLNENSKPLEQKPLEYKIVNIEKKVNLSEKNETSKKETSDDLVIKYQDSECIRNIEKFLNSKNIKIKTKKEDTILFEDNLSKLANFIGKNYENVKEFVHKLKIDNTKSSGFSMNLKEYSSKKVSDINQLAKWLYDIGFLENYTYKKSPNFLLFAKLNRIPKAINFILGGWMEIYIRNVILKNLYVNKLNGCYIKNYQITLPNEKDFELDLVFKTGDDFFWFETKTGDYQQHIQKYSDFYKMINLSKERAFLVLSDMTQEGADILSDMYEMKVVRLENFEDEFKKSIGVVDEGVFDSAEV